MLLEVVINVLASAILVFGGFVGGKYRERRLQKGRNLEDYDFYPFGVDDTRQLFFDLEKFRQAVRYFLKHRDDVAARQLIIVGQQNDVLTLLQADDGDDYRSLFRKYDGDRIRHDTDVFLANFKRIVRLVGDSFPDTGIEILLHDLTNPSKALCCIKNNVTGRNVEAPATNLVLDLKIPAQQRRQAELRAEYRCAQIQVHDDPHLSGGLRAHRCDLHQRRCELSRLREQGRGCAGIVFPVIVQDGHAARREYTE